jgi:hypothetical protein
VITAGCGLRWARSSINALSHCPAATAWASTARSRDGCACALRPGSPAGLGPGWPTPTWCTPTWWARGGRRHGRCRRTCRWWPASTTKCPGRAPTTRRRPAMRRGVSACGGRGICRCLLPAARQSRQIRGANRGTALKPAPRTGVFAGRTTAVQRVVWGQRAVSPWPAHGGAHRRSDPGQSMRQWLGGSASKARNERVSAAHSRC